MHLCLNLSRLNSRNSHISHMHFAHKISTILLNMLHRIIYIYMQELRLYVYINIYVTNTLFSLRNAGYTRKLFDSDEYIAAEK